VAKVKAGGVSGGASSSSGGSSGGGSSGRNISGVAVQGCPASRKPFHVVLTATADNYQSWQCRIMYHHWQRVRDSDPAGRCTELTGFTRLVASPGGRPDGLEAEIPSHFTPEYEPADISRFHGYRVINRPRSVTYFLKSARYAALQEEYLLVAETDHVLLQPLPNLDTS